MARPALHQERTSQPKSKLSKGLTSSHAPARGGGHKGSSSVLQPIKVSKQAPKTRQTVSAAGIFKRGTDKTAAKPKQQRRKQRSLSTEEASDIDLSEYYHEGTEEARAAIDAKLNLGLVNAHKSLARRLEGLREDDRAFLEKMGAVAAQYGTPLGDEGIESTVLRNGESTTQKVRIGDQVARFRSGVERESARLKTAWKKWEDLTTEFADLAAEVFGPGALGRQEVDEDGQGEGEEEVFKRGFKREMEALDLECEEWVAELAEEIGMLKKKTLSSTKSSEQALTSTSNREYQKILHAVFME